MANPFYVDPQNNILPGLQALGNSIQKYGEIKRQDEKQKKAEEKFAAIQQEATAAMQSEDPQQMHEFTMKNPEWAQAMNGFMGWSSEGSRKNYLMSAAELRANPTEEKAKEVTQKRQKYLQSIGAKNTKQTDSFLEQFAQDPDPLKEKSLKNLDMSVASVATKDEWDQYQEAAGITKQKTGSPLTNLGKLNDDFANGNITKEQYESQMKKEMEGEGEGYAPSSLEKKMNLYDEYVDKYGEDHWKTKKIRDELSTEGEKEIELTPLAVQYYGYQVYKDKKNMPSFGRGKAAERKRTQVSNEAARVGYIESLKASGAEVPESLGRPTDRNIVDAAMDSIETATSLKAIQGQLSFLEKQRGSMDSFVENLGDQIDAIKEIEGELQKSGVAYANKPWRTLRKFLGTSAQNRFDLFLGEISRETSKLATGSTQSIAAPAVEETRFWDNIHDRDLPWDEMVKLLDTTKQAADIRMSSVENAIERSKQRLRDDPSGVTTGVETKSEPIKSWKDY